MYSIIICLVLTFFLCILFLKIKKNIYITLSNIDNLDRIIIDLRKRYKKMSLDKRYPMDLCNREDELGKKRDSIIQLMGNNCEPFIARECIYILDHILLSNSKGLEWSSGSSTIWLSYRLKNLTSIEHSKGWVDVVKKVLKRRNLDKKTKLLWINKDNFKYCKNDKQYIGDDNNGCFKSYVSSSLIPEIEYDFISVDGRARTGCLLRSIKMIKKRNGIIIIDNAERERYKWSYNYIPSNWSRFDFWYDYGLTSMIISH